MKILYRLVFMLAACFVMQGSYSQTIKNITVAHGSSYTDHLSLNMDSKDMDLMVKFVFDEDANTLTVSLISYRTIFVFWDRVRMKPLVKCRKIRPEQLPYVASYEPTDRYKITKLFKSTVPRPRKTFYFQRWMDYDGLQPIPQEYKMVNEFISQSFDILNKRNLVTFSLHDIFLMDKIEKKKYTLYEIPFGRDVNIEYHVTIQRNPCLGLEEELATVQKALDGVSNGYKTLRKNYGQGKVDSEESLKVFEELKKNLLDQYPKKEEESPCSDIVSSLGKYNLYVDSISSINCVVEGDKIEGGVIKELSEDNAKIISSKARQIDNIVSRWLVSTDTMQRRDLVKRGQAVIDNLNEIIGGHTGNTPQMKQAISMFRSAERYFLNTCTKR